MKVLIYFSNLKWLFLSCVVVFLDFISKHWVMCNYHFGESVFLLSFLNCYYVHNYGIAFSLFNNFLIGKDQILLFIIILVILILLIMLCLLNKSSRSFFLKMAYAMIIGGALGNLLDRIRYGCVIDFIDIHIWTYHLPTFNFADLSIFVGILIFLCIDK